MVRVSYHAQCSCGVRCSGELSSLSTKTGCINEFECRHFRVKVSVDTRWGFLLGFNAKVEYTFDIKCKCGQAYRKTCLHQAWGVGNYRESSCVCRDCNHLLIYTTKENKFLALEAVIDAERIVSLLASAKRLL